MGRSEIRWTYCDADTHHRPRILLSRRHSSFPPLPDIAATLPRTLPCLISQPLSPQPGDILVRLDSQIVTDFKEMEAKLDYASERGATVSVEVERHGATVEVDLGVQDLHAVTPNRFVDFGGACLHQLSYQQARNFNAALGQVYVAEVSPCARGGVA